MKHTIGTITCLLFYFYAHTQFIETFSDGNLQENPAWNGDLNDFKINSENQLQLNALEAGRSIIYTNYLWQDSMEWSLDFELHFSPSNQNQVKIYLASLDFSNPEAESIYFELGQSGPEDPIHFYHHVSGKDSLLFIGRPHIYTSGENKIQLKVICRNFRDWEFWSDYHGENNLQLEDRFEYAIAFQDNIDFGFVCNYSSTRKDKFYFDNIKLQKSIPDVKGPVLESLTVLSPNQIEIKFNEVLDSAKAKTPEHYLLNGSFIPESISMGNHHKSLVLQFGHTLTSGASQSIQIQIIQDLVGNNSENLIHFFDYYATEIAGPHDIIINEIMADPNPPQSLPEEEYIELYNPSRSYFQLSDYKIQSGSSIQNLPEFILKPNEYVILCHDENAHLFEIAGDVLGLSTFPVLRNGGDDLSLLNRNNLAIHSVEYDLNWYQDSDKENGGWSLELINPSAICQKGSNWIASTDPSGGSPGKQNSVFDSLGKAVRLLSVKLIDSVHVEITCDGILDETFLGTNTFEISPFLAVLDVIKLEDHVYELRLLDSPQSNQLYTIKANDVQDCQGQMLAQNELTFTIPGRPSYQEIIINEILFNPLSGGVDYLELYNRSNKIFDLIHFRLINYMNQAEEDITESFLFYPNEYVVITKDPEQVSEQYHVTRDSHFITQDLPPLADDHGNISLFYLDGSTFSLIDSVDYSEENHSPFIDDVNGVSLERITQSEGNSPSLWHSAAASSFYGTPGKINSQRSILNNSEEMVQLVHSVFSPDGDAYKDQLILKFNLAQAYQCSVKIFNERGQFIHQLASNFSIGSQDIITWDGRLEDGRTAAIGPYLLHILLYNENGQRQSFKKACVLALQLE